MLYKIQNNYQDNIENFLPINYKYKKRNKENLTETLIRSETLKPFNEQQKALILEGQKHYYIGVETPRNLILDALKCIPEDILNSMRSNNSAHVTLLPPNEKLHPSRPISAEGYCQIEFNEITLSKSGNVNLRGTKNNSYSTLTKTLADAYQTKQTSRAPHCVIGYLPKEFVEKLFNNPEPFRLTPDNSREQPLLSITLDEPLKLGIYIPDERPMEQRLLAMAYGETVLYAKKPLTRDLEREERFSERKKEVTKLQQQTLQELSANKVVKCPHYSDPVQFNAAALKLAMDGDNDVGRVPLTFSMKAPTLSEGKAMWSAFRNQVATTLVGYGYNDSYVSLLGSGTTGYSGNPDKPLKAWTPNSDVDCAIFSPKLAAEHYKKIGLVNTKISAKGKYSVFKNKGNKPLHKIGFYETPVGKELEKLSLEWTKKLFGQPGTQKPEIPGHPVEIIAPDEIDFKLNIEGRPFDIRSSAITFFSLDYKDKDAGHPAQRRINGLRTAPLWSHGFR
ncbi:MAG: hypothetical protein P8X89_09715 [Reinekea sp.]